MMIEILYFARIREILGMGREQIKLAEDIADITSLIDYLCGVKDARWSSALHQENLLISVNQTLVAADHGLKDGDEVAFFPPVSGG